MANDTTSKKPAEPGLKPAPDGVRCEAGGGTCGAGQPLFDTNGLVHCEHHSQWPASKEGRIALATKQINEGV